MPVTYVSKILNNSQFTKNIKLKNLALLFKGTYVFSMEFFDKINCIDLFCGAGGLTRGLLNSGINVVAGYDIDTDCAFPYEKNNSAKFIKKDIGTLNGNDLRQHLIGLNGPTLLAGCAPCQPFSTYSQRYETVGSEKWALLHQFARLISELKPDFVAMENVPQVVKHSVFQDFESTLVTLGYRFASEKVNCKDYGLPQGRKRAVLVASLHGNIELNRPTSDAEITVRDAISKLPKIDAGVANTIDPLHVAPSLSDRNIKRIKASKPGGTWRDWPKELIASCHDKPSGKTYSSVYGRMEWDKPSPSLTTQFYGFGNGRYGHPEQDRAISLREGAILQGFPDDYQFTKNAKDINFNKLGRLIGNAVPVRLGEVIGSTLVEHVKVIKATGQKRTDNIAAE